MREGSLRPRGRRRCRRARTLAARARSHPRAREATVRALLFSFLLFFLPAREARAAPTSDDPNALFGAATAALGEGRATEAIADLEALADRGVVDPVASYDRGLAYAMRVRIGAEV